MRRFQGVVAFVLALVLMGAVTGCDNVAAVATVNGEDISQEYFDRVYQQVLTQMGGELDEATALEYKKQLLATLIESELITQEAEKLGADLSEESVDASITALMGEMDEATLASTLEAYGMTVEDLRISVRDQLAREFLIEKAVAEYEVTTMSETYSLLSHILVDTEEAANALYVQLQGGADFAELASANSTDTASAVDGGSLGWSPTDAYVPQFADAANVLGVGETSAPVQSDYGWHIIKKVDEYAEGQSIADAPAELRGILEDGSAQLALNEYVQKLRDEATIKYIDETLKPSE
ncbi:MAG: peptidylprolyl isomerase [Coriobacteriia bacterium]